MSRLREEGLEPVTVNNEMSMRVDNLVCLCRRDHSKENLIMIGVVVPGLIQSLLIT
jgi:hypothetical protein